ncbi:hypothetical protein HYQ45_013312 [Verticillium longisporum]|nr:hypothetical protein HYQ45_013312 [Verticillium longisporum]
MAGLNVRDPADGEEWGYRLGDDQTPSDVRGRRSEDHRRSNDMDRSHSELVKRASTRGGRRKAGEGLSNLSLVDSRQPEGHGAHLAPTSSRLQTYDEESSTEAYGSGYHNNTTGVNRMPSSAYSFTAGNNLSPVESRPHPLQSQPYGRQGQGQGQNQGPAPQR